MNGENKTPSTGYALDSNGNLINWVDLIKSVSASLGENGAIVISDQELHEPDNGKIFFLFEAVEDEATINSAVGNMENIDSLVLSRNGKAYGVFSNVKLTSGKIIAYMREV